MNLRDAILQIDRLKPNKFSDEDKAMWLSELDGKIFHEIVETHQRPAMLRKMATFEPYISGRDDTRELLAPAPHDVVYRWWLECQIDIGNNEIARYNNSRTMFASAYAELQAWWNRMYMPMSPVHAFSYDDHQHHHHHEHEHIHKDECEIEARDIEYALGYVPERQGEAQAAREALEELIDGEADTRAAGDTNTLIEAKRYADIKVLKAKTELEGEQGTALEEYKAQVDASLQGIAANAATALSKAGAAGNKADTATSTANEAKSAAVSAAGQAAASVEHARQAASAASGAAADAQAATTDAASAALRADMAQAAAQRAETAAKEAAEKTEGAIDTLRAEIPHEMDDAEVDRILSTLGDEDVSIAKLIRKINRKLELIETITFDGATVAAYRNQTPSGKAYDFDMIRLAALGDNPVMQAGVLNINGDRLYYGTRRKAVGFSAVNSARYVRMDYSTEDGHFEAVSRPNKSTVYSESFVTDNIVPVDVVTAIEWQAGGVTPPAGATLEIWGRWR